jgi:hypothetical protein
MDMFPPGVVMNNTELEERLREFTKWYKTHKEYSVGDVVEENKWDSAQIYALALHDGMMNQTHNE